LDTPLTYGPFVNRDYALAYNHNLGWSLLACWWIGEDGRCACGDANCGSPGKHPIGAAFPRGVRDATGDPDRIREVWERWPLANVAVACGPSGLVVVDCDVAPPDLDGTDHFISFMLARGERIRATTQRSGGGGVHFFYRTNGQGSVRGVNGWRAGVDIKAEGGYVLLTPSNHAAGAAYRWRLREGEPRLGELDEIPKVLAEDIRKPARRFRGNKRGERARDGVGDGPEYDYAEAKRVGPRVGMRDDFFNARVFELRKLGVEPNEAERILREDHGRTEQIGSDPYGWDRVVEKFLRVYRTVDPDPWWDWERIRGAAEDGVFPHAGRPGERALTDDGNALRLVDQFGGELRYVPLRGEWLVWDGTRWREDNLNEVTLRAREVARGIYGEAAGMEDPDRRRDAAAWAAKSEETWRVRAMITQAQSDPRVTILPGALDQDPWLLNCPNGTLNLRTGELRGHDPRDLITRLCPTAYNPEATDERWDRALRDALVGEDGDTAMLDFFRRFSGYCLTGITSEKAILVPNGPTNTGKSTVTEPIFRMLGEVAEGGYATTWGSDVVEENTRVNRDEKLNKQHGARLVVSGEMRRGSRMADNFVKLYSGGDTMDHRALYHGSYSMRPQGKLVIHTNYVPRSADPAVQGRLKLLPFERVPAVIDPGVKEHLDRDPGAHRAILAWAVRGCLEWQREGLGATPWLGDALTRYARESDPMLTFIHDCLRPVGAEGYSAHVDLVWAAYGAWAEENLPRRTRLGRYTFNRAMEERGHERVRIPRFGGPVCWRNLTLNANDELSETVRNAVIAWDLTKNAAE
jgi:putative DNA primase/helicase